jgi:CHAD domain-containing protein
MTSGTVSETSMREHEFKFLVPDDFEMPGLDDVVARTTDTVVEQTATYYDTADLRLARAGASLRFRDEDGWTVKLPTDAEADDGPALVRSEFVFGGRAAAPPTEALELVAALVRTARLAPAARLRTVRRRAELRSGADAVGTLTDDDCTVVDGRVAGRFREIELELADDAPSGTVHDVVDRLRAAGADDEAPLPKVVRALGPTATAPADVVSYSVGKPATVDAVIRHAISDSVAKLVANDPVVRIGNDPEGVHQARVATRRLRSHLRTFRDLLDPEWTQSLRDELKWLGDELGAVRDADVLLDRLERRVEELERDDQTAAEPLLKHLREERDAARAVLLDGLRSDRYLQLLDRLVDAAQRPRVVMLVGTDHEETLRDLVRAPWKHLRNAVDDLPDPAPDPALHQVRIRAKRARYAAEVVEPAFGKDARRFAKAVTEVQDVLGEHQDSVVAAAWLRANALTLGDPRAVYVAGELGAMERAAAETSRVEWPKVWKKASKKRLRDWL